MYFISAVKACTATTPSTIIRFKHCSTISLLLPTRLLTFIMLFYILIVIMIFSYVSHDQQRGQHPIPQGMHTSSRLHALGNENTTQSTNATPPSTQISRAPWSLYSTFIATGTPSSPLFPFLSLIHSFACPILPRCCPVHPRLSVDSLAVHSHISFTSSLKSSVSFDCS